MSEITTGTVLIPDIPQGDWTLPSRGTVGMVCLIAAESAIFIIFVVAYIFYIGKSLAGPFPRDVLELPIFTTMCLLSSSVTVHLAVASLQSDNRRRCSLWLAATVLLGATFLGGTAYEWYKLIVLHGLTIRTNLFGTTFYSLVGLHASHAILGLAMLSIALIFSLRGDLNRTHADRLNVLSYYWHFVDTVWVAVFFVVYVFGR